MGWKKVNFMDERVRFTARHLEGEKLTDLCREFGISRKTGYKFIKRYEKFGVEGLTDRSRRPVHLVRKTSDVIEQKIVHLKGLFPTWGPKKLKVKLELLNPGIAFPAISTVGEILDRNGLVKSRKKRNQQNLFKATPITSSTAPNEVWCTDFKGQFKLGNQNYCYPLTITDHFSRYLIGCEALVSTRVQPSIAAFEEIFDRYGLPSAIKSDNGVPFSSQSFIGLSELSAWWMSLGISVQRSRPGHPQDNGRHERMHRTLKAETTRPAGLNQLQQQERFEQFKLAYNEQRPHEALAMKTPSTLFTPSTRTLAQAQADLNYPLHDTVKSVRANGSIRIENTDYFIGAALRGHKLGLRELECGLWLATLGRFDLGFANPKTGKFTAENPNSQTEE